MERGLNYLDLTPAYGRGECEESYGKIIDNNAKSEKIFMTTKVSGYPSVKKICTVKFITVFLPTNRNIINDRYMEKEIELAKESGTGIIAMKAAMALATQHKELQPIPEWRIQKVQRILCRWI